MEKSVIVKVLGMFPALKTDKAEIEKSVVECSTNARTMSGAFSGNFKKLLIASDAMKADDEKAVRKFAVALVDETIARYRADNTADTIAVGGNAEKAVCEIALRNHRIQLDKGKSFAGVRVLKSGGESAAYVKTKDAVADRAAQLVQAREDNAREALQRGSITIGGVVYKLAAENKSE